MASLFSFYICIPLLYTLYYVFTNIISRKLQNLPPSPIPLPLIGHLHLLKSPIHRTLSKLSDQYGPVYILRFGFWPVVVVSSPSAAEECLVKNDAVLANRPRLMIGKCLGSDFTSLPWIPYGDLWRNVRRIMSLELLSNLSLQNLSGVRTDEVRLLIRRLIREQGQVVDIKVAFFELSLNNMMRMMAGKRYYGDNVEDVKEVKRFREIQVESAKLSGKQNVEEIFPFMRWTGISKGLEKSMMELQRKRDEIMQDLIDEHKARLMENIERDDDESPNNSSKDYNKRKTMVEVLLSLQQNDPENYRDEIIRGLMLAMLFGATDTSTLEWGLSLLINHPELMKKVQSEIDEKVGHGRVVDESDLNNLPYLQSIIIETLRMYPSAPLLVPHLASKDCTVGGYRVPAGTTLFINAWGIQNNPHIWEDPETFKPERFEGFKVARKEFKMMPFGSGRRGCPGEGLAMRVIGSVLGSLIQCFDWETAGGEKKVDMTEEIGISLAKAQPLKVKCRPRPGMLKILSKIESDNN